MNGSRASWAAGPHRRQPRIRMSRTLVAFFFGLLYLSGAQDPVQWTLRLDGKAAAGSHVLGKFTGTIESGWHLYSPTTPKGGPIPTTVSLADSPVVAGVKLYEPKPERKLD